MMWFIILMVCGGGAGSGCHSMKIDIPYISLENCQKAADRISGWTTPGTAVCIPDDLAVENNK